MKIRESELIKMIKHSLNESKMNATGRVNNKKRFIGQNTAVYNNTKDENGLEFPEQIVNNAVIIKNFINPATFEQFKEFAKANNLAKKYWDDDPVMVGAVNFFRNNLHDVINQLYGTPLNDDFAEGTIMDKNAEGYVDPLGEYKYVNPKSPNCPFYWDQDGYVMPKKDLMLPDPETGEQIPAIQLFEKYFEVYTGDEASLWDYAVVHENQGEVIFFFENISDRKTFTKQIKNMFWIARHDYDYYNGGGFKYYFYAGDNPFEIIEYDNWDTQELVPDEENEIDTEIRDEILRRKKIQDDFLKSQELEPEPEVGGEEEDGDDYAAGFENGVFHDANGFRVKGPVKPIRENKNRKNMKKKITESQLRQMVRDVLKEALNLGDYNGWNPSATDSIQNDNNRKVYGIYVTRRENVRNIMDHGFSLTDNKHEVYGRGIYLFSNIKDVYRYGRGYGDTAILCEINGDFETIDTGGYEIYVVQNPKNIIPIKARLLNSRINDPYA